MFKFGRFCILFIIPFIFVIFGLLFYHLHQGGVLHFNKIYDSRLIGFNECKTIYSDAIGAEDALRLQNNPPLILLSSAPRLSTLNKEIDNGGMFLFDIEANNISKIELEGFNGIFHPHGISLYKEEHTNKTYIFIVNHQHQNMVDQVLIFEYKDKRLIYEETIEDNKFISLNDIYATSRNTFYSTNDHGKTRDNPLNIFSTLFPELSTASVVYWNGKESFYAVKPGDIDFANGIQVDTLKKQVFIANTMNPGSLHIYSYKENHEEDLILENIIPVYTGIDNLDIGDDGFLYAGCHPNLIRFLYHVSDPKHTHSPSQVLQFNIQDINNIKIKEIYLNNGDQVSASSTGLIINEYLLITPVFVDYFALCK